MRAKLIASALLFGGLTFASSENRIINGVPVPKGHFTEVVAMTSGSGGGARCTATVVGPRTILTAGHCVKTGDVVNLEIGGRKIPAKAIRHPEYPVKEFDIAILYTEKDLENVAFATIGTEVEVGQSIYLFGYGCTEPGGGGGNDHVLRMGESTVTEVKDFIVSRRQNGGALCFGDSGGPTYIRSESPKGYLLVGVGSKGNIQDTNWSLSIGSDEVLDFLSATSSTHNLLICGLNKTCYNPGPNELKFKAEQFVLAGKPGQVITKNLRSLLSMPYEGEIEWSLDDKTPSWVRLDKDEIVAVLPTKEEGSFSAGVVARAKDNVAIAIIRFAIENEIPAAPACTITATPQFIELGQSTRLTVEPQGIVAAISLFGNYLPKGTNSVDWRPNTVGVHNVQATVTGPGGSTTCVTRVAVK